MHIEEISKLAQISIIMGPRNEFFRLNNGMKRSILESQLYTQVNLDTKKFV